MKNGRKLGRLVEELLELSRLEAQKASLKEQPTPLVSFCRQLFSAYHSGAALKAIDYSFHSELPEDAHFWVDRNRLEKVINNLLSNALKFTPKEGRVQLTASIQEEDGPAPQLLITVTDTGRGIPPEDLPHIFERYFQTRREGISTEGGAGIGLALSKELAQLMNGSLSVESEWGQGARFCLRLPARKATPAKETEGFDPVAEPVFPDEQKAGSPAAVPSNDDGSPRSKVLIVEDNRDMQQLLLQLLADEYDCILANHGAEAWAVLEAENTTVQDIELILSDVMMPEMDGYTLLEKIKTIRAGRNCRLSC
ncbi:MAG: response regulator [Lewinellaceae bacterium]|nr:response regulator [Lewinellaceae bacterium]